MVVGMTAAAVMTGDRGSSGEANLIAHSVDAAADAGTARAEYTATMSGAGIPQFDITGDAEFDFVTPAASMTMQFGGASMPGVSSASMEMRMVDNTMYLGTPGMERTGIPTEWLSVDLLSAPGGADVISGFGGTDPTQSLDLLRGAADVEEVGPETVRGVPTTRYRAVIDLDRAIAQTPEEERAVLEQAMQGVDVDEFPVEVWLDDAGRPVREFMEMSMDLSAFGDVPDNSVAEIGPITVSMTMDYFDYGTEVTVVPPPAHEVTDITSELDRFSGALS